MLMGHDFDCPMAHLHLGELPAMQQDGIRYRLRNHVTIGRLEVICTDCTGILAYIDHEAIARYGHLEHFAAVTRIPLADLEAAVAVTHAPPSARRA